MNLGEVQRQKKFLFFFDNFYSLITHTHKNDHSDFLLKIRNCPAIQNFSPCFHLLTKPNTFTSVAMTKLLFAQNVLGLTLILCIVFITNFFPWLHVKRCQSTEVRQFCLRLKELLEEVLELLSIMLQMLSTFVNLLI